MARPFPEFNGIPAFGITLIGIPVRSETKRSGSRMCSGPVEQFSPLTRRNGLSRDLRPGSVDLVRAVGEAPLRQPQTARLERVGLEHIAADLQEPVVDRPWGRRTKHTECVHAAFILAAAEVIGGE